MVDRSISCHQCGNGEIINFDYLLPEIHGQILRYCVAEDVPKICIASRQFYANVQVIHLRRGSMQNIPNLKSRIIEGTRNTQQPTEKKFSLFSQKLSLVLESSIHSVRISFKWSIEHYDLIGNHVKVRAVVEDEAGEKISECGPPSDTKIRSVMTFYHKPGRKYVLSCYLYGICDFSICMNNIQIESLVFGTSLAQLYQYCSVTRYDKINWKNITKMLSDDLILSHVKRQIIQYECDAYGNNLLHLVCRDSNMNGELLDTVRMFIKLGGSDAVLSTNRGSQTPLHFASRNGNIEVIRLLIDSGGTATVFAVNNGGQLPLHYASKERHVNAMKVLVDIGGPDTILKKDNSGHTPLHVVCTKGSGGAVNVLTKVGGMEAVLAKTNSGITSLFLACKNRNCKALKELVNTGGLQSILAKDAFGETALHLSSKMGLVGAMKILIEKGGIQAILSKNNDDETPLHYACRNAQFSAVELLIRFGEIEAVSSQDCRGQTPIHFAAIDGTNIDVMKLLIDVAGAKAITIRDNFGQTSVHFASKHTNAEVVKFLVEAGGVDSVKTESGLGQTPLHLQSGFGNVEVMKILIETGGIDIIRKRTEGGHLVCHERTP